jgi:hypothetical protein
VVLEPNVSAGHDQHLKPGDEGELTRVHLSVDLCSSFASMYYHVHQGEGNAYQAAANFT